MRHETLDQTSQIDVNELVQAIYHVFEYFRMTGCVISDEITDIGWSYNLIYISGVNVMQE